MSNRTTLVCGSKEITVKEILHAADNGRLPLNRAIVVCAVKEGVIAAKDIRKHFGWINDDVLQRWSIDAEVITFFPKILTFRESKKEAPSLKAVPEIVHPTLLSYRELSLDSSKGTLWWKERSAILSYHEKTALPLFFREPERIISHEMIYRAITRRPYEQGSNVPDQIISSIRIRCLDLGMSPPPFLRVRGGYKLTISH